MEKKVGSLSLIFLLLALLLAWWAVSALHLYGNEVTAATVGMYTSQDPLSIKRSFSRGTETYSGSLQLSDCQNLQTNIAASGVNPAHLQLSLVVIPATTPCTSSAVSAAPFAVSVSTQITNTTILDSVLINNTAAAFLVVDTQ